MTFDARENSLASGQPIRLFRFTRNLQQWCYSSGDRFINHLSRTYEPVRGGLQIDGGISQGGETGTDSITIIAPAKLDVAQLYRGIPPSDVIVLTVFERHFGDEEYLASWIGEVQFVRWPALDRCKIDCVPDIVSMQQQGLRLRWERACPHNLYDRGCFVDRNLYAVSGTILSMDAFSINVSAASSYADGWFKAGYAEWALGNENFERRAIEHHAGTALTLLGGTTGLQPNRQVTFYPGCDQTPTTCNTKFGNMPHYGGVRHVPGQSPFDSNPFF